MTKISKAAFVRFLSKSANAVIKVYVESYESFSRSEMNNKNEQRGDFIQDENNSMIKSFLPPGMPSAEIWHRVCRKATTHKEIKLSVCDAPDLKKIQYKRHLNEITMMHRETKLRNFLIPVKSIDSIPLYYNLFNISTTLL